MDEVKSRTEFKELFDLARSKKYLTYDEVNDSLPPQVMSAPEIDEILVKIMTDYNVELVASEKKIPVAEKKARRIEEDGPEDEEEEEIGSDPEAGVRGNDPVKMYLHEMGCVSLLTREGEVEIAKRIEKGEQQVFGVIIGCPVTIKEVLALGDKLQKGTIRLKEVVRGLEDEDVSEGDDSGQVEKVLTLIDEMKEVGIQNPVGINFSTESKQEMAQILRERLSEGRLRIPFDRSLLNELNVEQYQLTKTGKIAFSHLSGTHDDRFWALALATYAATKEALPQRPIARII